MAKRTKIHLAPNLIFDTGVITRVFGIIAKRDSGKTYTATKLAEGMLLIKAQIVAIDPVGNWYGLRLGANGKPEGGLDIKILGGRNGDIPLEYTAGALIAKTIVESGMSFILDLSMMRKAHQERFATDFAVAMLEERKRDPAAMHIFFEEAYRFFPQKMTKGSKSAMLEATEELVTMGRNFGIGATLICQRAAQVSKTALTQASILIAMNTVGADRKVILDWIDYKGMDKNSKEAVKLSTLGIGQAFVWWPEEFGIIKVKVAKRVTYDASSTPKFGEKKRRRKLKAIDLEALEVSMTETIEKAKASDPKLLQRKLATAEKEAKYLAGERHKLELELVEAKKAVVEKVVEVPVIRDKTLDRLDKIVGSLSGIIDEISSASLATQKSRHRLNTPGPQRVTKPVVAKPVRPMPSLSRVRRAVHPNNTDAPKIAAGALRMLKSLAAINPGGLTRKQVATASAMKSSSGTFGTYWSKLNVAEFIYEEGGRWFISESGFIFLGDDIPTQPDSPEEKVDFWCQRLNGKAKELLKHMFAYPEESFDKAELGDAVGLSSTSGTFGTYLSSLTSNNLAVRDGAGMYRISPDLMV